MRRAFLSTFALLGIFVFTPTAWAARFSVGGGDFKKGCDVSVPILISTEGALSNAANIILRYNPAEVQVRDALTGIPGVQLQPGAAYEGYASNTVNSGTGEMRLTGFSTVAPLNTGGGSAVFANVLFKSLAGVTNSGFSVEYTAGATDDSNIADAGTSADLLTSVTNSVLTFSDGPCVPDTQAPRVQNQFPAPGASGVPLNTNITFRITDNQSGVDLDAVTVTVGGVSYTRNGANRFTATGTALDYTVTVDPAQDFLPATLVTTRVTGRDLDGNVMGAVTWEFNRPPAAAPTCESLGCFAEAQACVETPACEVPASGPGLWVCGNNSCEVGETSENCRFDCSAPEVPAAASVLEYRAYGVLLGNGERAVVRAYPGMRVEARYTAIAGAVIPQRVVLDAGFGSFEMTRSVAGYWSTTFLAPMSLGSFPFSIESFVGGVSSPVSTGTVVVEAAPVVTDIAGVPVSGATVRLYSHVGTQQLWNGPAYGQLNPAFTDSEGGFRFVVPPGRYSLQVEKPGFAEEIVGPFESGALITGTVRLGTAPLPFVDRAEEVLSADIPAAEKVGVLSGLVLEAVADAAGRATRAVQAPEVREASEDVVAPVATALVAASAVTAGVAQGANVLAFLQYLFTQPLLYLARRKRKGYGVVYHSLTKMPVPFATVRLLNSEGALVQTRVTDAAGRYFFAVKPGVYTLQVTKPGFASPSAFVKQREDAAYTDVYRGEEIAVTSADAVISANVPVDPVDKPLIPAPRAVLLAGLRSLQHGLAVFGVVAGLTAFVLQPSVKTLLLAVLQGGLYWLFRKITFTGKPKGWGIVYDEATKQPLAGTVVRIFEPQYNKLLDTFVTDGKGRYSFLVGPNQYYTTFEKAGYAAERSGTLDYSGKKDSVIVGVNVGLKRAAQ